MRRRVVAVTAAAMLVGSASALAVAGALDPAFSGDGKATTAFPDGTTADSADGAAIQADGKIVIAGSEGGSPSSFAVVRYRLNGTLDPSFSGDGRRAGPPGDGFAVAVQPNGRIVVAGEFDTDIGVARYLPDGRLDQSFSGDGKRSVHFGGGARRMPSRFRATERS
jgi:uncharacterized delta-60 repeat protein